MPAALVIKIVCLYILVAAGETLNGIARMFILNRLLGVKRAKQISLITALCLCFVICYVYVPTIGFTTGPDLIWLGVSLSVFMITFDVVLSRCVMKSPWPKILNEFDLRQGNLLTLGVIFMAFCPLLALRIPRIF